MTTAQYLKDRNKFGPTSDDQDQMPEGNVRVGGNIPMAERAPNYYTKAPVRVDRTAYLNQPKY